MYVFILVVVVSSTDHLLNKERIHVVCLLMLWVLGDDVYVFTMAVMYDCVPLFFLWKIDYVFVVIVIVAVALIM